MKAATAMLLILMVSLGLNMWDSARGGHWIWFTISLLEFWCLGGILFWWGIEKFNARQRRRRAAQKAD